MEKKEKGNSGHHQSPDTHTEVSEKEVRRVFHLAQLLAGVESEDLLPFC